MSKRIIFIGLFALSILCFSPMIYTEQYYDQYPGNSFLPKDNSMSYYRDCQYGYFYHNDNSSDPDYTCPVHFDVPDGSTYFIKSIGMRYKDNLTNGYIRVDLMRANLYTGNQHIVATWSSGESAASTSVQTASQGTEGGVKLVDTKKFVYCPPRVFKWRISYPIPCGPLSQSGAVRSG